jgi:hypothetical protein
VSKYIANEIIVKTFRRIEQNTMRHNRLVK